MSRINAFPFIPSATVTLLGVCVGVMLFWSCDQSKSSREDPSTTKNDTLPLTEIEFKETMYHFGKVTQGDKVEHQFEFKNTGKKPLKIYRASASCGCTTPEYPESLIQPGEKGYVTVRFNSSGREGEQKKKATVVVNTKEKYYDLKIQGEVVEKKAGAKKKSKKETAPTDSAHE